MSRPRFRKKPSSSARLRERILQPVVDHPQQAGAEGHREHFAGQVDVVAVANAVGFLEHLQVGHIAIDAQDFGLQTFVADADVGDFVLHDRAVGKLDADDVAVDAQDFGSGSVVFVAEAFMMTSHVQYDAQR